MHPLAATLLLAGLAATAATQAGEPAFEAASVKAFPAGTPILMSGCVGGPGSDDPGHVNCEYVTVKMLVMQAYDVKSFEVAGPSWLDSDRYNIIAKVPTGATREQLPAMYRGLMVEHFHIAVHRETRPVSGYALTIGGKGAKLTAAAPPAPLAEQAPGKLRTGDDGFPVVRPEAVRGGAMILYRGGRAKLQGTNVTLARFVEALSRQLDRPIQDDTGLSEAFDIVLYWTPEAPEPGSVNGQVAANDRVPDVSIFQAVEQQLGLRLGGRKVERSLVVVEK
jgi:uncharacterized protein (TIGR03435 family)